MDYNVIPRNNKVIIHLRDGEQQAEMILTPREAFDFAKSLKKQAKVAKKLKKQPFRKSLTKMEEKQ